MNVILPCLALAALGLLFGAVHMLSYRGASEDSEPEGQAPCAGANCGACGFAGCGAFARAADDGRKPADGGEQG